MFSRLPIRRKILLVAAIPILAMIALAAISYTTIQAVKVGSSNFARAEGAQELVADVLPPPLYVVEAWAELNHMQRETNAAELKVHKATLARTEKEYKDRYALWAADKKILTSPLRKSLLELSDTAARQFFTVYRTQFLPALERQDFDRVQTLLYDDLENLYDQHRAAVLETVKLATAVKNDADADSKNLVNQRSLISLVAFLGGLALAVGASIFVARSIIASLRKVRDGADDVVQTLTSTNLDKEIPELARVELDTRDELADAANSFNSVVGTTVELLERQRQARQKTSELFVNLGRRNQNLVSRQLRLIDELEHTDADAETLTKVFKIDHIATRMRRNAESLLVMAGLETPRRWKNAVPVTDVVRSTVSEVEQFERVDVANLPKVRISGKAAADVAHMLAELVENAVRYSPPDVKVRLTGQMTSTGSLRLAIVDQGTGMNPVELAAAAERLSGTQAIDQAQTAFLGHFVAGRLASRHGITIRLDSPGGEGLSATVEIPAGLLSDATSTEQESAGQTEQREGYNRTAARRPVPQRPAPTRAAPAPAVAVAPAPVMAVATAAVDTSPEAKQASPQNAESPVFTEAGYRKRTPKAATAAAAVDRFAIPEAAPKTRSSEAMRDRLSNFTAGKARASDASTTGATDENEGTD